MIKWAQNNLEIILPLLIAGLPAIGWAARWYWSGERDRQQAQQLSTIAQTIATMRAHNVTFDELRQFQQFVTTGQRKSQTAPLSAPDSETMEQAKLADWAEAEPQTQAEMNEAARLEFESRDRELSRVILSLGDVLSSEEYDELQTSQARWLEFREAHAQFIGRLFEGGSMQPLWYITTVIGSTNDRIDELKAYLELRSSL